MGQLISLLKREKKSEAVDLFLNFEDVKPNSSEEKLYNLLVEKLKHSIDVIDLLKNYEGGANVIKKAIENPEMEAEAIKKILPSVIKLKKIYEFSYVLEDVIPRLLNELCSESPITKSLDMHQALTKLFAEIMQFVLTADGLKMNLPAIQNDFSFYRRCLSRGKFVDNANNININEEFANKMSLFYAYPTPFLKCTLAIVDQFSKQLNSHSIEEIGECFSAMAMVCQSMVDNTDAVSRFKDKNTLFICLGVMTSCTVLYDHVNLNGAFSKKSNIDIKSVIRVLREHQPATNDLINSLKYSTKHFQNADTPKTIRSLLEK